MSYFKNIWVARVMHLQHEQKPSEVGFTSSKIHTLHLSLLSLSLVYLSHPFLSKFFRANISDGNG